MSVDLEGARCDEESARLLPWYVTGRLSAADLERVSNHLQHCAICRNDAAHERVVRELLKADALVEYAPQAGLAKTLSRIDELGRDAWPAMEQGPAAELSAAAPLAVPDKLTRRRIGAVRWLSAAVVLQAVALGWLGASLRDRPAASAPVGKYQTLSTDPATAAPGAHIRAVFAPGMTLGELKSLLAANHLMVIRGPSDAGAYTLASADSRVGADGLDTSVTALRSDARVLFVEPAVNDMPAAR
ncbi:MAG TPA: zf-HC2 domain-containing protein [Steroidobacteraceae bacterium]|nr:zf-HC2 domain-containing protein [Steroidobacteraceae bacterium]